ncbi:MAG: hypothetical protein ACOY82_03305 [Pseudomonadota bacterium]
MIDIKSSSPKSDILHSNMIYFRRQGVVSRFAIAAIIGMLWSQIAIASHADCVGTSTSMKTSVIATAHEDGRADCHDPEPKSADSLCFFHCAQHNITKDVAQVDAPRPILLPTAFLFHVVDVRRIGIAIEPPLWPTLSRHRPTRHPAELLLI